MSALLFEKSRPGRRCFRVRTPDVPKAEIPEELRRETPPRLPEIAEVDLVRHFNDAASRAFGVNDGFYPLGSCTMKYNPCISEEAAALEGFTAAHPLQGEEHAQGSLEALWETEKALCAVTGMDAFTFQPAAGAHGEFTGLMTIREHLLKTEQTGRVKVLVPDSAHGTNPASAVMAGFEVINVPSSEDGQVDLRALRAAVGPDTAALMLTNPNTLGLFDTNILEITRVVHEAGGLCYYDGANLNAVMGLARPGDMGFDVVHLNLHKTFSTPHGGGGPGSGPVGCKKALAGCLPGPLVEKTEGGFRLADPPASLGRVKAFYGNFLVVVRALCYLRMLGGDGLREASENAVLNANYLMHRLKGAYRVAKDRVCMHEFVLTLETEKEAHGVSAMDVAKAMIDRGMHPPTMYFPLIVHEALMLEPTETESRETLDRAAEALLALHEQMKVDPQPLHDAPKTTPIGRPDEVAAARRPILKYEF